LFGTWSRALTAADIDPSHGRVSPWADTNKAAILAEICRRKRARQSLRSRAVWWEKWGQPLVRRTGELFGSWYAALLAAGIEPQGGKSQWARASKASILAEIRRRDRAGESLRVKKVTKAKRGRALLNRAATLFGSWTAGCIAAGFDPPVNAPGPWAKADKAAILAEIRRRKRTGESLATTKIEREQWGHPLMNRCRILFGSWTSAILAAGVDPPPGLTSPWVKADKPAILAEIRRRIRARESLRYSEVNRQTWGAPLLRRAETLFGSWKAALLAAGVNPPAGTKTAWSEADNALVLAEIRRRTRAHESLRYRKVGSEKLGRALLRRSINLFGSWNAALAAAGMDGSRQRAHLRHGR